MARHAGFAAAISVGEAYLNQTLWVAMEAAGLDPISDSLFFTLPSSVPIGAGLTVRLSGFGLFDQRPTMTLFENQANTIRMTASADCFVAASINPNTPAEQDETWKVRLDGAVDTAIDLELDDASNGIYLRWLPVGSVLQQLTVTHLQGPNVPPWLQEALNSPLVRDSLNVALQGFGPQRITGKLFSVRLDHVQPVKFDKTGFSVFEWFSIHERIGRAVLRVRNGSISVGIDLTGLSTGNPDLLVDLLRIPGTGPVYRWSVFDSTLPGERPVIVGGGAKPTAGDIAVLFNPDVLTAIVSKISAQISGTPMVPKIKVMSVATRVAPFEKPLRGTELGLCVDFVVHHQDIGNVSGRAYLQPYLRQDGEPGPDPFPSVWLLYVGHVDIDVPWWIEIAVALAGISLAVALPALSPLVAVGLIAAFDGILPAVIGTAEVTAERALQQGTAIRVASRVTSVNTPKHQMLYDGLDRVHVNDDGLGLLVSSVAPDVRFTPAGTRDVATVDASLNAGAPGAFSVAATLRSDLGPLAGQCMLRIVVRRGDNGDEVARLEGSYATSHSVAWDHMTPELFLLDDYSIEVRMWLSGPSLTGLLFATSINAEVTDELNRHHPYVTWDEHWAHFQNDGTQLKWWHRLSKPTLHRTAPSARCLALRQRITRLRNSPFGLGVHYVDALAFDWADIAAHRDNLCDYCFFGGPTKVFPNPPEGWFR